MYCTIKFFGDGTMYNYIRNSRLLRYKGNEALKITFETPCFPEHNEITDFYSRLASNCSEWCENVEYPKVCKIFDEHKQNGGPRPPFRFNYSFRATVTSCDEKTAEIKTEILLYQNRTSPISSYEDTQLWSLKNRLMLKKKKRS